MPRAPANGIELEYEVFGADDAPPLLLIMGLGAQMILWDDEFCAALAARGHRVVRFDNRDVGLSSKLDGWRTLDVVAAMGGWALGRPVAAPYTLSDMAADTIGLLDALGLDAAHLVGASLGGMIAQTLAIEHPRRVLSLTSIMSTTGNPRLPRARPAAAAALLEPPPRDRQSAMARAVKVFRTIGSPGFPLDEARVRERAGRSFDRSSHPAGVARQMLAVLASGSRVESLRRVTAPTLVIHGTDDPLVPLAAGVETARLVPSAELLLIEGMGHDLPRAVWGRVIDGISGLTARAAPRRRAPPSRPRSRRGR
jgi:pimeloyl-ACP methyl ester carboxylesterase